MVKLLTARRSQNKVLIMKKVYLAPQTEAIEILADKVLMASAGGKFISTSDTPASGVYGD